MKSSEVLAKARDIIAEPRNWTKNAYARNAAGEAIQANDKMAVCWCIGGACRAVTGVEAFIQDYTKTSSPFRYLSEAALELHGHLNWVGVNDMEHVKHNDILALADRAIELALLGQVE